MTKSYAAYNTDLDIRLQSSSGGVFSLIADSVLKRKGVVYGVAMTADCYSAEFIRIEDANELGKLRGSKYFQAKLGNTYIKVKTDLEEGKKVLFVGTGCQVNGLKKFIGKEYDNLICVDVICHGVPSPKLWKAYLLYQEKRFGKLRSVNFRCKEQEWKNFGIKENEIFIPKSKDPFLQMFLGDFCLRPSCYECNAKKIKLADISIGDLWGIEELVPDLNDGNGCSWVIIRSQRGESTFEQISTSLIFKEIDYEDALKFNSPESQSVQRPLERDNFFEHLNSTPFSWMIKKYGRDSLIIRVKQKLKWVFFKIKQGKSHPRNTSDYGVLYIKKNN